MQKLSLDELGRHSIDSYKNELKLPIVVVLDNVRSALNVGSFFRTCDSFSIEKLILCGITAFPPHKEINKTAIGATETVDWHYEECILDAIIKLKQDNYHLIIVEQTNESINIQDFKINKEGKYALVFGNEVNGISDSILTLADHAIEIPQYGTKHSLNVAVCGGIVIWYFASNFTAING